MEYAIQEVRDLLNRTTARDLDNAIVRYVCSLFAELAYHHVPAAEVDSKSKGRAKLVPSFAYQALIRAGRATNLLAYLQGPAELQDAFVVDTQGAVAVGVGINNEWFIAFRGTKMLYAFDWWVNGRCKLTNASHSKARSGPGRFHAGFAQEAARISTKVHDAVKRSRLPNPARVFLTGHSLGGAVAAISHDYLRFGPTEVCLFGAPRYADKNAYANSTDHVPTQMRRRGDEVPTVPPRLIGYADHPLVLSPDGTTFPRLTRLDTIGGWPRFIEHRFHQHSIDEYRRELGQTASANDWCKPLTDWCRL